MNVTDSNESASEKVSSRSRARSLKLPALLAFVAALLVMHSLILRNITDSEPRGYYLVIPTWMSSIEREGYVFGCEPTAAAEFADRHHFQALSPWLSFYGCPAQQVLIKNAWGLPGDRVRVDHYGVWINGKLHADSAPYPHVRDGTPLPIAEPTTVPPGEVWVGSPVRRSYDSRYYGPVRAVARLILLVKTGDRGSVR